MVDTDRQTHLVLLCTCRCFSRSTSVIVSVFFLKKYIYTLLEHINCLVVLFYPKLVSLYYCIGNITMILSFRAVGMFCRHNDIQTVISLLACSEADVYEVRSLIFYPSPFISAQMLDSTLCRTYMFKKPIAVAARSKAWVCGRTTSEMVGSNPARGGMGVCLL